MAGYIRQDVTNNIATGNVINASDFDNEYNAIEAAFDASTGHTHDGTAAEGAPITKIGPTQDVVASASALTPKTDNTVDLGSSILEYKDLWIDGTANIDSLVADTADINAGTIDGTAIGGSSASTGAFTTLSASSTTTLSGLTASTALALNASKEVVSVTNTGTGNNVLATSPTLVTPALGTPSSVTLTNATGLPTAGLVDNAVTDAKLRDSAALSVIGRSANSSGDPADIAAGTDHQVLRRSGTALGFGAVALNQAAAITGTLPVGNGGTGITSFGTGVATALGVNTGTAGAFVVNGGALGTPSSGTVTNLTGTASININGTVGATTPTTGAFTTVTADFIYASNIANDVGSFTWNTATSSPDAATSVGSRVITPIHIAMRRCVVNDSGVVQYYLDPANSALKADGTASDLSGGDGQVMVEIPAFYAKREVSGTFITWSVSPVALPGYTLHPAFTKDGAAVDFRYYGAYDACVYDDSAAAYISGLNWDNNVSPNGVAVDTAADKLASVSGVFPMVGLTRAEFRTIAANRGSGWRQLDWTLFAAVQLLYLVEYQSFYSQNILGAGNTATFYLNPASGTQSDNGGSEAGKSNSIGNASTNTTNGASSAGRGVAWMSYRGIENFYGNEWNWVDGVIVNPDGTASANQGDWWFTNNSADFSDTVRTNMTQITNGAATASGFVSAIASVDNFFVGTNTSGGSSATYLTDQLFAITAADRVVSVGGSASFGANAGAFCVTAGSAASSRDRSFGARLAR